MRLSARFRASSTHVPQAGTCNVEHVHRGIVNVIANRVGPQRNLVGGVAHAVAAAGKMARDQKINGPVGVVVGEDHQLVTRHGATAY